MSRTLVILVLFLSAVYSATTVINGTNTYCYQGYYGFGGGSYPDDNFYTHQNFVIRFTTGSFSAPRVDHLDSIVAIMNDYGFQPNSASIVFTLHSIDTATNLPIDTPLASYTTPPEAFEGPATHVFNLVGTPIGDYNLESSTKYGLYMKTDPEFSNLAWQVCESNPYTFQLGYSFDGTYIPANSCDSLPCPQPEPSSAGRYWDGINDYIYYQYSVVIQSVSTPSTTGMMTAAQACATFPVPPGQGYFCTLSGNGFYQCLETDPTQSAFQPCAPGTQCRCPYGSNCATPCTF